MQLIDSRVGVLKARHQALEAEIQAEIGRPMPDTGLLADLKRQKLRIKDEIANLASETTH